MMPIWRRDEAIAREADRWLARLHGPDGAHAAAELERWRARDPRHDAALRRAEALWRATGEAARTQPARPPRASPSRQPRFAPRPVLALASIAAVAAVTGAALWLEGVRTAPPGTVEEARQAADAGTVTLADGSIVRLGPDSRIVPHFEGRTRGVTLVAGSARFSVAHDPLHPFVVTAGDRQVTARGTIFDVALRPAGLMVTMIEGVVEVGRRAETGTAPAPAIRLQRGDRLTVTQSDERLSHVPPERATFRNYAPTPLARLLDDANAGAAKPIRLGDAALGAERVEGRFDLADTAALARQLAAALDLDLRDDAGAFTLVRTHAPK